VPKYAAVDLCHKWCMTVHYSITHCLWEHARWDEHTTSLLYLYEKQFHIYSIKYKERKKISDEANSWQRGTECRLPLVSSWEVHWWPEVPVSVTGCHNRTEGNRCLLACPGTNNSFLHSGITKRMNEDPKISETSTYPPAKQPPPPPSTKTYTLQA
jgi:hypothetical protein